MISLLDWILLFLFIMKFTVLWAVAACVSAADLSCEEYCTYLFSGLRDVEYQPDCDCLYEEAKIDDSGIYYEPARSIPTFIYNHPFYIINPVIEFRHKHTTDTDKHLNTAPNTKHVPGISEIHAEIDINAENPHSSHKRREKDIQVDNVKPSDLLYLDIDVESDDSKRSVSTNSFNAESLKLTERSLSECVDLYSLLSYRKDDSVKHLNSRDKSLLHKYDNLSNRDLINAINNKCLHISYIVDKSLNEIKEKRPKKINNNSSYRRYQENRELQNNKDILSSSKHNVDMITEANSQIHFSENSGRRVEEYDENKYSTFVYTHITSEENNNSYNTLSTQVESTDASTSNQSNDYSPRTAVQIDVDDVLMSSDRSTELYPIYTDNEDRLDKEIISSIPTVELSTPTVIESNKEEGPRPTDKIIRNTDSEKNNHSRKHYEEDVPLPKIITREFSNHTVQSYINGTEDVPNEDSRDANSSESNFDESMTHQTIITGIDRNNIPYESDVHGKLYFLVNQQQIPAKFVQNPNGTLHLGIDAISICNKIRENRETSKLLLTLCKCYESDNCARK